MNPRDEIKKTRERLDEIEAGLPTSELDEAINAVLKAEYFIAVKKRECDKIVFKVAATNGEIYVHRGDAKPLFSGRFYIEPEALLAIARLDKVFKQTHDC